MGFFLLCQAWFPSNPVFCCGFHNFPSIESDTQLIYAIIYYIWFFYSLVLKIISNRINIIYFELTEP